MTIFFGITAQTLTRDHLLTTLFGGETWFFLSLSTGSVLGAVTCAVACLWSRHGANSKGTFAELNVKPAEPDTYRPEVLWYFGSLANLQMEPAVTLISRADARFEVTAHSPTTSSTWRESYCVSTDS